MKVALMFSGQPRNVVKTYEQHIKPNLLEPNKHHDIDIFVHIWYNSSDVGKSYLSAIDTVVSAPAESTVIGDICRLYDPVTLEYTKQIQFDERDYNTNKYPFIKPFSSLSKMFSNRIVMNSVKNYSLAHDISYDLIVSGRFDWGFQSPILLDAQREHGLHYVGNNPHGVNVGWCSGNMFVMDTYCDLFENVDNLFRQGVPFCDEILAEAHMKSHNIPVHPFTVSYIIVRE